VFKPPVKASKCLTCSGTEAFQFYGFHMRADDEPAVANQDWSLLHLVQVWVLQRGFAHGVIPLEAGRLTTTPGWLER
jgi:hypothetical protein